MIHGHQKSGQPTSCQPFFAGSIQEPLQVNRRVWHLEKLSQLGKAQPKQLMTHGGPPAVAEGDPGASVEAPANDGLHRGDQDELEDVAQGEACDAGLEEGAHEGDHGEDHGQQEDGDGEGAGEGEEAPPVVLLLLPLLLAAVPA